MLSLDNISVHFGGFELFNKISFLINKKDRIGLVGKNGAGKSTLVKILASKQEPTEGRVSGASEVSIGYLPQQMALIDGRTVKEESRRAFDEILTLQKQAEEQGIALSTRTDYESDEYMKIAQRLAEINDRLNLLDSNQIESKLERTLRGLGFMDSDFDRQTSEFSGGWRMRIELVKLLLSKPDVLLLDEPTNHLDIMSIQWLERFLSNYHGAVVLISHDRTFLNNVTNRTIEIVAKRAYDYKVPYSAFVELRKEQIETQMAAYRNQQKMIEETEDFIERFRYKATKAVQVQSRIKQLEKVERIEIDEVEKDSVNIRFAEPPRSGNIALEIKNLGKSYGSHQVLDNIDLTIERGKKIAFVGKNGEGKTTLSRIIVNELDYTGQCKVGHNVKIGYFAQNQDELLDGNKTVFETIDDIAVGDIRKNIKGILGAFLFRGEDVDKKVRVLSGGEKTRLALVKLMLEPYNMLVLDEPTNHLDMNTKDILKNALMNYQGTVLLVSHDREFLSGMVDIVYEFKDKGIKEYLGGIQHFLDKCNIENPDDLNIAAAPQKKNSDDKETSDNKLQYLERKELDKQIRKVTKQVEESEKMISKYEAELEKMDNQLISPEGVEDHAQYYKDYQDIKLKLEQEMEKWEQLNFEVEELEQKKN
ncbi:MAG: ABC-F family ATP-binding cassette domain-containing protein [Bacteroidales bacterium]|nr:ABC-F family ATP-binding cassette domain-containing protein [Bacteroidales bacterium]